MNTSMDSFAINTNSIAALIQEPRELTSPEHASLIIQKLLVTNAILTYQLQLKGISLHDHHPALSLPIANTIVFSDAMTESTAKLTPLPPLSFETTQSDPFELISEAQDAQATDLTSHQNESMTRANSSEDLFKSPSSFCMEDFMLSRDPYGAFSDFNSAFNEGKFGTFEPYRYEDAHPTRERDEFMSGLDTSQPSFCADSYSSQITTEDVNKISASSSSSSSSSSSPTRTASKVIAKRKAPSNRNKNRSYNAFFVFMMHRRDEVRRLDPFTDYKELTKRLARDWAKLCDEEKHPFKIQAREMAQDKLKTRA